MHWSLFLFKVLLQRSFCKSEEQQAHTAVLFRVLQWPRFIHLFLSNIYILPFPTTNPLLDSPCQGFFCIFLSLAGHPGIPGHCSALSVYPCPQLAAPNFLDAAAYFIAVKHYFQGTLFVLTLFYFYLLSKNDLHWKISR